MESMQNKSDNQIRQLAYQAIKEKIGVIGLIRFIQQFETGANNYTEDRREWQDSYTVKSIAEEIKEYRIKDGSHF